MRRSEVNCIDCLLSGTSHIFFEPLGLLTSLEFAKEASLAGQQAPGICVSDSPALGLQGHTTAFSFWEPKLSSHAFKANTF